MRSARSSARSCGAFTSETELYFLSAPGRIKIGISRKLKQRLREIGKHTEVDPVLLGVVPGSFGFEQHIHARLTEFRLKGEWFKDCPTVRSVMNQVLAGDELGYEPKPNSPGNIRIETRERTPEEWLVMFNNLVALVFPGDPVGGLADDLEISPDLVRNYLKGIEPVPRIVAAAFASRLLEWMGRS